VPREYHCSRVARELRRAYRTEVVVLTFRALKSVALADGVFHKKEKELLEACTEALTVRCPDIDEVEMISPDELAASVIADEPEKQAHILTLMVHMALVDGEEHPSEFALVKQFAAAFGVEDKTLEDLRNRISADHGLSKKQLNGTEGLSLRTNGPMLARAESAVVLGSRGFFPVLTALCHR
jgi:uncharacterized tellurite resistance protein B-like protein